VSILRGARERDAMPLARRILVATDFSPHAARALDIAIELARLLDASLTVLHVCQPPAYAYAAGGVTMIAPAPELITDLIAGAEKELQALKERLAARGIAVDTASVLGEPRDVIPQFARERGHDLIITGSHGRRGFRRFFLGSVAEHVVRAATVPVLVVHQPADNTNVNATT
jgi:nucleotide-binding universal stress UspA family protein